MLISLPLQAQCELATREAAERDYRDWTTLLARFLKGDIVA
jgi:hypothetical protein